MANRYFYFQKEGGHEPWSVSLATQRDKIVAEKSPRYTTVLDLNQNITNESEREQIDKLAYWGDLYVDIDVSVEFGGIETAIVQVNTMLDKFEALGANLDTFRIFASGSKGFHIEVPRATFLDREPKAGTPYLPLIYKEMVHTPELFVDGVDNRVYTAGRGRMWRTTNVQRENGKYKVQITLEECRGLTPDVYHALVTGPREPISVAPPQYCPELAVMYATAIDQVTSRRSKVKKTKQSPEQIAKWSRNPPSELKALLAGKQVKEDAGWHPIALQVALSATTLGWSVDEMLDKAQGLIESHEGDGSRYNSPRKRERELVRMWHYYQGGSGVYYDFAIQPIKALLNFQAEEAPVPDDPDDIEVEDEEVYDHLTSGMKVRRSGIYREHEGVEIKASALGLDNIVQLIDTDTHQPTGYQCDVYVDGRKSGSRLLGMDVVASRLAFQGFALSNGGAAVHLNDSQVLGLAELLRKRAQKEESKVYMVAREGMDYIKLPDGSVDALYISDKDFFCNYGSEEKRKYALKSVGRDCAPIGSDLLNAPELEGSEEERRFIDRLLRTNKPECVGKMLGWFSAAFQSQALRNWRDQFPLLHIFGTAGAGKTKSVQLYSNMHFYHRSAEVAAAASLTNYAMKVRLAASASIPIIWDEVKFHEMNHTSKNLITQYLRNNYAGIKTEAGNLSKASGVTHVDLREYRNSAPLVFIGETMETETAIAERYVGVALTKHDRAKTQEHFNYCYDNKHLLGHLGKTMIANALVLDREAMIKSMKQYIKLVERNIEGNASDESRRVYNYAVVLYGLETIQTALERVFPGVFGSRIEDLQSAVLAAVKSDLPKNMSEASKTLDVMAFLTKMETDDAYRISLGQDYTVNGPRIDIKLQNAFTKYMRYCRSIGTPPLFPDYGRFVASMRKYSALVDDTCLDNEFLKDTARVDVFRFDTEVLAYEGVDSFRS